ncbi:hypothetical protein A0H81_02956 [Grifola frondosa]|uniref:G-protein coupled receptors family 1 profile domain-containing protein n=1 Tax=Grifola frondosa TaxID=5627 RepID=A0A1C7MHZ5_GRIFR|nr:hypothetical protein A0H81_02956 [Grifola frondosa]
MYFCSDRHRSTSDITKRSIALHLTPNSDTAFSLSEHIHLLEFVMVNWHDPSVIAQDAESFAKISIAACSIYLWEWVVTVGFEWRLITRQMRWKWPMLICILCRVCMLISVILVIIGLDITTQVNCQVGLRAILFLDYLCLVLSSLLIVIRVIAIWNWNQYVIAVVTLVYCADIAGMIYGNVMGVDSAWDPVTHSCQQLNDSNNKATMGIAFDSDILLLILTFVGVWRQRGSGRLWKFIYRQGVIWIIIATIFYIPNVVLICLELNAMTNLMFSTPVYVALTICATRMQMSLYEHTSTDYIHASEASNDKGSMKFAQNPAVRTTVHNEATVIPISEFVKLGQMAPRLRP